MKKVIAAICIVFTFMACQKEYAPDLRLNNAPDSTILLKKFAIVDVSAPTDTLFIYNYTYDNLNRCIKVEQLDVQNNERYFIVYNYNGTDSSIIKAESYIENFPIHGYEYFTYNSAGQMIKDSTFEKDITTGIDSYTLIYNYAFSPNKINGFLYSGDEPFIRSTHIMQYDGSGNILSERDSSFEYVGIPPTEEFRTDMLYTSTYDDKKNPFYNNYPKYPLSLMYENANMDDIPLYYQNPKNNITSQSNSDLSPTPQGFLIFNDRFTYSYNTNNYPATVIKQDITNNKVYKGFYFY